MSRSRPPLPLFATLLILAGSTAAQGQSIPNPGFEIDPAPAGVGYTTSITGWTSIGINTGFNPAVGGSPFADNGTIPDPIRVGFIQSANNILTGLSTTITGLSPRDYYRAVIHRRPRLFPRDR